VLGDNAAGGSLNKVGTGTLTLTGSNIYAGPTIITAGTLQIGNGDSGASIGSTSGITNDASLVFNQADAVTFSPVISGIGSLTQTGSGMLVLTNSNTYCGGTTISGGTLQLTGTGTLGAGPVTDNATLVFALSGNPTYSGLIAGSGNLVQACTGTLTLANSNTYTGSTLVNAGTLALGNSLAVQDSTFSTSGSGAVSFGNLTSVTLGGLTGGGNVVLTNTAGAAVALSVGADNSGTTYSGVLSDGATGGGLNKIGTGALTLTGSNTYTGPTTITAGTLQIGYGTANGSIATSSSINDNATLAYNVAGSQTFSNAISGCGGLYKAGGGTLTLTGNNTFSGLTTVYAGCLAGNTTSLPSAINVGANANVTFSQAVSGTFSQTISGNGSLTVQGPGGLTLAGDNSYTGGTTIAGGIVRLANYSALGSGVVTLAGGTLGLVSTATGLSASIGIQFVGYGSPITGSAGVVPMSNWNSLSGWNFASLPLTDNSATATMAALTISGGAGQAASGSSNPLLSGYIYADNYGQLTATLSGIPYASYCLYAYMSDLNPTGIGERMTIGGKAFCYGMTSSASYIPVTNTTPGTYPTGNYVMAPGLTGSTQTVTVQGVTQGYGSFSGFEIVNTSTLMFNAITLTADSTIDVTGASNGGCTGLLTIGNNRLSVTGGGVALNTAYSLTLGSFNGVSLTGNPTFDVANNGSGAGTLILGALGDGGVPRTITKTDAGALTLAAPASSMNAGDTVIISGGTLNSNNATALGTLTTVNVAAGATFSLGASQTVAALGDAGTVVLDGATVLLNGNTLTVGSGNNLSSTFSGVIADGTGGSGSLVKAGTGTFTFNGSDAYSGTTTISAGTLILGNSAALQQSALNTNGSGVLNFGALTAATLGGLTGPGTVVLANALSSPVILSVGNNNASTTFAGALNGGGGLMKVGSGVLYLAGTNTYAGITAVNAGRLEASTTAALPGYAIASQVSVANGATLAINVGGPNDWASASVDSLLAAVSFVPGGNLGLDTTNGNFSYGTNIAGSMGLTKLGGNTLLLTGTNTYTGPTVVTAGTLEVASASALPGYATPGEISVAGGAMLAVAVGGSGWTIANIQTLLADNGSGFASGSMLGIDTSNAGLTYNYSVSGSMGLTILGGNALVLAASNSYGGNTLISGGTLVLGNANALKQSTLDTSGSGALNFGSLTAAALGGLTGPGTLVLSNTAGTAVTLVVGGNNASTTFAGSLNGAGALTKVGSGELYLAGTNSYAGKTTVNVGTLEASTTAALSNYTAPGQITIATGATLAVAAGGSGWTAAGISWLLSNNSGGFSGGSTFGVDTSGGSLSCTNIAGRMGLATLGGNALVLTGASTYSGPTLVTAGTLQIGNGGTGASISGTSGVTDNGSLVFNHTDAVTFSKAISGSGSLTQTGSGILTLTGTNSYTGPTTIGGGTLQIGNGSTDGSIASSSGILNNGALVYDMIGSQSYANAISGSGGLYKTGGGALTLTGSNAYSGPTTVLGGSLVGSTTSLPTTINLANNANVTFSQAVSGTFSNTVTGSGSLTVQGPGALTLAVSNSYTGGTTIANGTVRVINTSALGSGAVALAGGTLSLAGVPSIGIQFVGTGTPVNGPAGVAPISNWNNLSGFSFSNTPLVDNSGATTTATLSTSVFNEIAGVTSSNQLLSGCIAVTNSGPLTATISGIPYANYSLYAYMGVLNECAGKIILGGTAYYYDMTNSPNFIQVTNTTVGSYPAGNYVVATGLTGATQTVTVQGVNQPYADFSGLEIVDSAPASQTWSLANAVALSANSIIDVTGPSNGAITGVLTIGSNRLSVTGGGAGPNLPYSLTLGASGGVLLTGNPTFDVANNGSGAGTLILGALSDGGTACTITKTDAGALTLSTPATSMNAGDTVIVSGGTLNSNNATALGTLTTVNVAAGATLSLGASQTLAALGDAGTVVLDGATVLLNGNALTVGSSNNLSSTFSGVIADGPGGPGSLIKAGSGSLVLAGSDTYTGGTTVVAGTFVIADGVALEGGTSLTVGAGSVFVFDPSAAAAPVVAASPAATPATVPEPSAWALLAACMISVGAYAWRKQTRRSGAYSPSFCAHQN
jgi:autotransporter-associated beta strand protein